MDLTFDSLFHLRVRLFFSPQNNHNYPLASFSTIFFNNFRFRSTSSASGFLLAPALARRIFPSVSKVPKWGAGRQSSSSRKRVYKQNNRFVRISSHTQPHTQEMEIFLENFFLTDSESFRTEFLPEKSYRVWFVFQQHLAQILGSRTSRRSRD